MQSAAEMIRLPKGRLENDDQNESGILGPKLMNIRSEIFELVDRASPGNQVIVDMRYVEFMDEDGLNILLSAYQRGQSRKVILQIQGAQKQVNEKFHSTRLDTIFFANNNKESQTV